MSRPAGLTLYTIFHILIISEEMLYLSYILRTDILIEKQNVSQVLGLPHSNAAICWLKTQHDQRSLTETSTEWQHFDTAGIERERKKIFSVIFSESQL